MVRRQTIAISLTLDRRRGALSALTLLASTTITVRGTARSNTACDGHTASAAVGTAKALPTFRTIHRRLQQI